MVIELFADVVPRTAENFRALCTGEHGLSPLSNRQLFYKKSLFNYAVKGQYIQGGDVLKNPKRCGESIYGEEFDDENLITIKHDQPFLLSMVNQGRPNTNGSIFRIITAPQPDWDGRNVVFGRVIRGQWLVKELENAAADGKGQLYAPYSIYNCGQLPDDSTEETDGYLTACGGDLYANWPEDNVLDQPLSAADYIRIADELKAMGIKFMMQQNSNQQKDYFEAGRKFEKSIRYAEAGLRCLQNDASDAASDLHDQLHFMRVACYLNISLCHSRRQKPHLVQFECTKILEELQPLRPEHQIKALYRRGIARKDDNNLQEALRDLEKAYQLDRGRDRMISQEYFALKQRLSSQKQNELNAYRKIFTPSSTVLQR